MTTMITLIPHTYAGRNWGEGDEFDCEDKDVQLLLLLGRADLIKPEADAAEHEAAIAQPALIRSASQRAILKRRAP